MQWLAYGSLPHQLVHYTLLKHQAPSRPRELICSYNNNFSLRVSSGGITSGWCKVEVGIITGCNWLMMYMLIQSAELESRGPKMRSGLHQPPTCSYVDDLRVTSESVPGGWWILQGLETLKDRNKMSFKPDLTRISVVQERKSG